MGLLLTSDNGDYTPPPVSLLRMSAGSNPSSRSQQHARRRRNHTGIPDADTEVVALSPNTLMATNRFVCEICNKGFQRDQNLQLHRRGHNLPWKLRRATGKQRRRVYVCPEPSCEHHHPSMALGDLTGIKKHFSRKHCEKNLKCDKCGRLYAVFSDWKAHAKTCGTREYRCDCGTIFNRKDSFLTHRAFCEAITKETLMPSPSLLPSELNFNVVPPEVPAMLFGGLMMSHSTDNYQLLNSSYNHAMNFDRDALLNYELNMNNEPPTNNTISMAESLRSPSQFYDENLMISSQMPDNSLSLKAPQMGSFVSEPAVQPFCGKFLSSSLKSEPCSGLEVNGNDFGHFFGLEKELMRMENFEMPVDEAAKNKASNLMIGMPPRPTDNRHIAPPAPAPPQSSFLTRDFLGMGVDVSDSSALLQRELEKFIFNAEFNLLSCSSCGGAAGDR